MMKGLRGVAVTLAVAVCGCVTAPPELPDFARTANGDCFVSSDGRFVVVCGTNTETVAGVTCVSVMSSRYARGAWTVPNVALLEKPSDFMLVAPGQPKTVGTGDAGRPGGFATQQCANAVDFTYETSGGKIVTERLYRK